MFHVWEFCFKTCVLKLVKIFRRPEVNLSRPHEELAMYSVKAQLEYSTGFLCHQGISIWVFFFVKHGPTYELKNTFSYVLFKVIDILVLVFFLFFVNMHTKFIFGRRVITEPVFEARKNPNALPHIQVTLGRGFF